MFDRYHHVMLYVTDLPRAVDWYRQNLGFEEEFVADEEYGELRHPGMDCRIALHQTDQPEQIGRGPMPWFEAARFDAALATLRKLGIDYDGPLQEGDSPRFINFRDSEGNLLGLQEGQF